MEQTAQRAIASDDPLALAATLEDEVRDPELLIEATHRKAHKCIELLLARGADPNGTHLDLAPLHRVKDAGTVKVLVDAGADVDARGGLSKMTPLLLAASNEGASVIKALLNAGADPDATVTEGSWEVCALQRALRLGRSVAVKALLKKPPSPEKVALCVGEIMSRVKADGTLSPKLMKMWAALLTAPDLSGLIPKPPLRPIHMVAATANVDFMRELLAAGADPNGRGGGDLTAAFSVVSRATVHNSDRGRCVAVLELLVAAGADLDVSCTRDPWRSNDGKTTRQLMKALRIEL